MSLWGRIFAAGYDSFMGPPEKAVLRGHRKALLDRVKGRVLEIGDGTGANLPFYGGGIEELVITEPEEPMARRLERKLGDYPLATRVVRARAEELPFEDERFDFVVSTLVLCTVDDPARARARCGRSTGCSSRTASSCLSSMSAPTSLGSPAGRTASTASRFAWGTAAIATAERWRASKALASRSRSSSTTRCAKHRRSCGRSSWAQPSECRPRARTPRPFVPWLD
jgi:SAM-dependent methyltransferase